jgi:uncharacterized protein YciI/uncharacterized protein YndB with AHSA1/START domain
VNIKKSINVEATQQRAFRVFTEGMGRWWPQEHHIGAAPLERMVVEPRVGGRWYEQLEDGTECVIGRVLEWSPYERVVLAWQITAEWKYDPSFVTEVEVTFTAEGPRKTCVELEHKNIEKFGPMAEDIRKTFESDGGWTSTLNLFSKSLSAPKYMMVYASTPESRKNAPAVFAAHDERLHEFHRRGKLLMAGPVMATGDAYGVFTSKEAAEEFVAGDPFISGGVVTKHSIVEWMDVLD